MPKSVIIPEMVNESENFRELREAFGRFGDLDSAKNELGGTGYEISFSREFDELLGRLAAKKGVDRTEVIRRAVASYFYLQNELKPDTENGEKHLVIRNGEEIIARIELP